MQARPAGKAEMCIASAETPRRCIEEQVIAESLDLAGADVLDLGCGPAIVTRSLAAAYPGARFVALEVDAAQHALNSAREAPPNLVFGVGGAEAIPADDGSFDVVTMFKSLHHVPGAELERAMAEIRRVLRPGGTAYVSEPVFAGELNEILRIFHDEERVRGLAFDALRGAVAAGTFELVQERFFLAPVRYRDFAEFETRVIRATHSRHVLTSEQLDAVRERFLRHCRPDGAVFDAPTRVDILRRAGA